MATQLASDDLKTAVAGKTVTIDTPLGLPITVNYGANGLMTGNVGTALAVYLGSAKDRGRWHVRNGKLCQKWFKWLSGDMTCLTLRHEGGKIHWRSDEGQTGTAKIEQGPPAFDGVTASGLGLPPPAKPKEAVASDAPKTDHASAHHPAPSKPTAHEPWTKSVAVHKASPQARETAQSEDTGETPLIHTVAPATRPRFTLASAAPIPLPVAKPHREAERTEPPEADRFEGIPVPMRQVAEISADAMLEHRWCHSNAFAKGPASPGDAGRFAAPELLSVPSLLAVAQEEVYGGELPLHEPACLTESPAINILARFTVSGESSH